MQNGSVGVSKETYFEMCEMLGEEPQEDNIPVEFEDFPVEAQQALLAYRMLRDEWDSFSGMYLGKQLIGISEVLYAIEIEKEEQKFIVQLIRIIDNIRSEEINKKLQNKPAN